MLEGETILAVNDAKGTKTNWHNFCILCRTLTVEQEQSKSIN